MINFLFTRTPLLFFTQNLWRDEAFSYFLAKKNFIQILILTAKDFNPPLYYFVLHFWIKIFGGSEIALRSLSFIFYWATLYVLFLFLTNIMRKSYKKSIFYLIFFGCNPFLVYYAFEARMYTMFAFLSALSFYAFYKKNFKLHFMSTILALYTNYFAIFILIGQYLFVRKDKILEKESRKNLLYSLLVFVPWFIFMIINKSASDFSSFWLTKTSFKTIIQIPAIIYTGYEKDYGFYDKYIIWLSLAFILSIFLALISEKKNNKLFSYLLVWSFLAPICTALISFIKPVFLPRYLIFSSAGFLLLLVYILEKLKIFLKGIIICLLLIVTFNYFSLEIKYWKKSDYRTTFSEIKLLAGNNPVYITNELDYFVAQYYFDENRVFIYGKTYEELPQYVGKVLIPKEKITNVLPNYPKRAFVVRPDLSYDIEAIY